MPLPDNERVFEVVELNQRVKLLLQQNVPLLWVRGEVSNMIRAASGHWYFSLKDARAQVRCVMFRFKNQRVQQAVQNGQQIEVLASATLYEARGDFQLTVEQVRQVGLGALYEQFARLKTQLEQQGLFAAEHKQPLPTLPRCIGVVTSPQAAALRDILTTLQRRMPSIPVILYPTPVQGKGSEQQIAAAIASANQRAECEVLLLCRGGGSIEDLWAFNEPVVAHAVAQSQLPVVTGVGHETDFTIADFVADMRAATPTAAAQLVVPDRQQLIEQLQQQARRLLRVQLNLLGEKMQRLDYLQRRLVHPARQLEQQQLRLAQLYARMQRSWLQLQQRGEWRLNSAVRHFARPAVMLPAHYRELDYLAQRLQRAWQQQAQQRTRALAEGQHQLALLNPERVLARGYSMVLDEQGALVSSHKQLQPEQRLQLQFHRGSAQVRVEKLDAE